MTLSIAISEDRSQTITFASITDKNASSSNQTFTLNATASSGLDVNLTSSNTSLAAISGSTLTIIGGQTGEVTITASQSGGADPSNSNITYLAAENVSHTFSVSKSDRFINFASLSDKNITDYYDANYTFTLSASLSEGSGTIVFESNDTSLLTISGTTATMLAAGQVTITAEANETTSYNAASQSRSFNLLNKDQTITFAAIADTNTSVSQINPVQLQALHCRYPMIMTPLSSV